MQLRTIACFITLFITAELDAEDKYFRSTGGRCESSKPLPHEFDDAHVIWRSEQLPGNSTPCIVDNHIFMTTFDAVSKQLATVSLDRSTGDVRWKHVVPTDTIEQFHPVGSPASSTPACDGERLYSFFGSYGMICYDLVGRVIWTTKLGPFQDEFGASSSPVLVDGKVILNEDHDIGSYLIALDKYTGKQIWRVAREGFTRSYSTPLVCTVGDRSQIVVAGALKMIAYNPDDGKEIWWVNGLSRIVDTTPTVAGGRVYAATWTPGGDTRERISMGSYSDAISQFDKDGDGKIAKKELPEGAVLTRFFRIDLDQDMKLNELEWNNHARVFELAQNVAVSIRPDGKGDVSKTHVDWTQRRGLPTVPSPLVYQGVMYMIKDGGIITTLNLKDGTINKQGRARATGGYYASPVAGDGKVYVASESGMVTVLKAGGQYNIIGSHDFGERIMATPVLHDGRIYIRTDEALYCF